MTYNPTIPAAADDPSVSQGQMLTNFGQLEAVFDVDHVPFSTGVGAGGGRHDRVVFNNVAAAPGLATPVASLYTAAVAGVTQLFFENEVAGVNVQRQMTNATIANLGNPGTAGGSLYRIDSPLGITVYCGQTNAFSGARTVTFPVAFTALYTTTLTANDGNVQRTAVTQGVGGLTARTENAVTVNWMSIGRI